MCLDSTMKRSISNVLIFLQSEGFAEERWKTFEWQTDRSGTGPCRAVRKEMFFYNSVFFAEHDSAAIFCFFFVVTKGFEISKPFFDWENLRGF